MYLEFHDSVLAAIHQSDRTSALQLRPAYIHRSTGRPGIDPGEVYIQDLDIVIGEARLTAESHALPFVIWDGAVAIGEKELVNLVPGDLHQTGPVFLRLVPTSSNSEFTVSGSSIEILPVGEPEFQDNFLG